MPHKKQLKENFKILFIGIVAMLTVGTVLFTVLEGWSPVDSFYFVTMTATTVGYGDFTPTHTLSKIITVVYSLAIIPVILYAFTAIAKFEVERINRQIHGIERKQREQEEEMEKAERKIQAQRKKIKEQEEEIEKQEKKLRKQERITKEHEEELEIVEDVVEENMAKNLAKERRRIKKDLKGKKGK